jgi:hypothetical protein
VGSSDCAFLLGSGEADLDRAFSIGLMMGLSVVCSVVSAAVLSEQDGPGEAISTIAL